MPLNNSDKRFFELLAAGQQANEKLTNQKPNIDELRKGIKLFEPFVDAPADLSFTDLSIVAKAGHRIRLRYYFIDAKQVKPLIIFFPGNAFIYDCFEINHTIISKIAKTSDCNAVMVECRLAPEYPYPAPMEDAFEAAQYIFNHLEQFNGDKAKVILAGYSSGANLAAVVTNQFRHMNEYPVFHQLLISGGYDYTNSLHEFKRYELEDKMLDPQSAQFSFDCYSNESQRRIPTCSPYWEKDLSGLPPTTIMVAEYDGGRSQSEGYAKRLTKSGNKVEKIVLPGQTHATIMLRKACSDGDDPAIVAGMTIRRLIDDSALAEPLLENLVALSKTHFGNKLIACYVLGSLAHGGFSRYASDVDFAIILKDPFQPTNFNQTINKINKQILSSQLPLAEKISIYFATPETLCSPSNEIRFPAYDRLDLILNGKILYGEDIRSHIIRPEEKEIAIEGMKAYFQHFNKDELIFQIIHLDELIMQGGAHKAGKLILLPVRYIYAAKTGLLSHNIDAVNYFQHHCQDKNQVKLIEWAYQLRDLPLDSPAKLLCEQYQSIKLAKQSLMSIYQEFLKVYFLKLNDYQEIDLANKAKNWLDALLTIVYTGS